MSQYQLKSEKTQRLDLFLREKLPEVLEHDVKALPEVSNSKIRRLIVAGCVSVNGHQVTRPAFELRGTSQVVINFDPEKFFYEKQPDDIKFEVTDSDVLFEDENLIFINKPAFFPVEQTITGNRDNLHDAVVRYLWARKPELRNPPYVGIMHRLDRETSGIILFTKNRTVNKAVSDMFQSHNFEKKYIALVTKAEFQKSGAAKTFTVEKYMGRISGKAQAGKWGSVPENKGGLYSKTDFKVLFDCNVENQQCVALECNLYTGRTHQIRVHLSESRIPILGDELYGGVKANFLYLHASELFFPAGILPGYDSEVCIKAPVNKNWGIE